MRLISFALTERQFVDGSKTVTRRLGWLNLKPGTRLEGVRKAMGLKPGEQIVRLGKIEVLSATREPLQAITKEDCIAEGFPELSPSQFVKMFCEHMGCKPRTKVTRIVFRRISE